MNQCMLLCHVLFCSCAQLQWIASISRKSVRGVCALSERLCTPFFSKITLGSHQLCVCVRVFDRCTCAVLRGYMYMIMLLHVIYRPIEKLIATANCAWT